MKFRVSYLDKDRLERDIHDYIHSNRMISPSDHSFPYYFGIKKDFECDYTIEYSNFDQYKHSKTGALIIGLDGEFVFIDFMMLTMDWSAHFSDSRSPLENFEHIVKIKNGLLDGLYSWDSMKSQSALLGHRNQSNYSQKIDQDIDRILNRDRKINTILDGKG
jgi:hypothetical protein